MATRRYNAVGVLSRGPTVADDDHTIESQLIENVLSASSQDEVINDHAILNHSVGAEVLRTFQLLVSQSVTGIFPRWIALTPEIALVDINGRTTLVNGGVARFISKSRFRSPFIDLLHETVGGVTTNTLNRFTIGSLENHVANAVDEMLVGKSPATSLDQFTFRDNSSAAYVRNPNLWCSAIDLTGLSVWNSRNGPAGGIKAVTPRHVKSVTHWNPPFASGDVVRFVTLDNEVVTRTITAVAKADVSFEMLSSDITIGLLNSTLPDTIKPLKLAPESLSDDYTPSINWRVPGVRHNQYHQAIVCDFNNLNPNVRILPGLASPRLQFWLNPLVGDSGGALWWPVNGEAMWITDLTFPGLGLWSSSYVETINATIAAADAAGGVNTGLPATLTDLSEFTVIT